jgi:multidrug resistance protein, MATE family
MAGPPPSSHDGGLHGALLSSPRTSTFSIDGSTGGGGGAAAAAAPAVTPTRGAALAAALARPGAGAGGGAAAALPLAAAADREASPPTTSDQPLRSWSAEARFTARLAAPLVLQDALVFSSSTVLVAIVGRASPPDLAPLVLGASLFNVGGLAAVVGVASALETLLSAAYGYGSHADLGRLLQRALVVEAVLVAGVAALWARADLLLRALGEPAALASAAAVFVRLAAPGLAALAAAECMRRWLIAQHAVILPPLASALQVAVCGAAAWGLVAKAGLGLRGAAAAVCISAAAAAGLLVAGCAAHHASRVRAGAKATWVPWSTASLRGLGSYLRVALPSAALVCMEWIALEFLVLASGWVKPPHTETAVAVSGIFFQTMTLVYCIPLGVSAAASTRVGHELGAGRPRAAARAAAVAIAGTAAAGAAVALAVGAGSGAWARLFSSDPAVLRLAARVAPWVSLAVVGDAINGSAGGVIRGCGRQGTAAGLAAVSYWILGLPAAAGLAFGPPKLGVRGLWMGLACSSGLQAVAMATLVARMDWAAESRRGGARVVEASEDGGGGGGEEGAAEPLPPRPSALAPLPPQPAV